MASMSRVFSWSNDRLIRALLFFSSSGLLLYNAQNNRSTSLKPTARQWRIKDIVMGAKGVWDAVDTSPDLGGQNALKTFEMVIRHDRRPTRTEFESCLSLNLFSLTFKNILWPSYGGGAIAPVAPSPYGFATVARVTVTKVTIIIMHQTAACISSV